jgi:hypothetical protein
MDDKMAEYAGHMMGRIKESAHKKLWLKHLKETDLSENLDLRTRIKLNWILLKQDCGGGGGGGLWCVFLGENDWRVIVNTVTNPWVKYKTWNFVNN